MKPLDLSAGRLFRPVAAPEEFMGGDYSTCGSAATFHMTVTNHGGRGVDIEVRNQRFRKSDLLEAAELFKRIAAAL